jgi:hypothetical protein
VSRLLLFLLLGLLLPASAHPLLQNAMWVVFAPDRVRVAVNVTLKEIVVAQQVAAEADGGYAGEALAAAAERHADYVRAHLELHADGQALAGRVEKVTPPAIFGGEPEQTLFQYELAYALPAGARPAAVRFTHAMLREFPYAAGQPWEVTYVLRLKRADRPEVATGLLRAQAPQEFPTGWAEATVGRSDPAQTFGDFLHHGVLHILTGYDHLLFVGALVLAALRFWEMFRVVAAFTLAHTLTLALSALTGFTLPDLVVEPVIAGSIVYVALENLIWPRHAQGRLRLAVAFGFGLVHGLGFAGGLREAMGDLGLGAMLTALAAFSLGVELGHLAVVLPLFGLLQLGVGRWDGPFRRAALRYGSVVISLAGVYYLLHALAA